MVSEYGGRLRHRPQPPAEELAKEVVRVRRVVGPHEQRGRGGGQQEREKEAEERPHPRLNLL